MAVQDGEVNLSFDELQALYCERENLVHSLRQQLRALEVERDQALQGLHLLTEALRRRGCCDHVAGGGAL